MLATVYGDVHDIGKNLVNTILSNNGYTVYDLGKQVPVTKIIEKAVEVDATAIGLSALLVSTSKQMPLCVEELRHRDLRFPVMIGGAAINRPYAQRTLFAGGDTAYEPGVFYAKDAFEGLSIMDRLIVPEERSKLLTVTLAEATKALDKPMRQSFTLQEELLQVAESTVPLAPIVTPPFWGVLEPTDFTLADVWPHLDLKTLFRLHWGGKGVKDEAWESLQNDEFLPRLRAMQADAIATGWLEPRVRYGYFPVNREGNDLIFFDPHGSGERAGPHGVPAPTRPRTPLSGRLFCAARSGSSRYRGAPDRDRGQEGDRTDRSAAGAGRLFRELLHPWTERADRGRAGGVHPSAGALGDGHRARAGKTLFVGLSSLSRSLAPRACRRNCSTRHRSGSS